MNETTFDFDAAGYQCPGDWARLRDLMPKAASAKPVKGPSQLQVWQASGSTKAEALRILTGHGIDPGPYDAEAARSRNA